MQNGAFEEVGQCREANMRMRPDGNSVARAELCGAHVIEEDERTDPLSRASGQRAANFEFAEVMDARLDQ